MRLESFILAGIPRERETLLSPQGGHQPDPPGACTTTEGRDGPWPVGRAEWLISYPPGPMRPPGHE